MKNNHDLRGIGRSTLSRRTLLTGMAATAFLAACGGDDDDGDASPTAATGGTTAPTTAATTGATTAATTAATAAATTETEELRLVPLPPEELGAPAVPVATRSTNANAVPVAEAQAAYDPFGTDAAAGVFPRTVRHAMGEVTLDKKPERVIALDSGELDTVVQLGIQPVGVLEYNADLVAPYLLEAMQNAETVGTLAEPDLEAIAALQPDLILTSKIRHEALYEQLSSIAPVVYGISTGVVWKQNFRLYSQALGLEEEADVVVRRYEDEVKALNAKLPEPRPSVSVVRVLNNNLRYYQRANYSGTILTDLGFPRPPSQNVDDFALVNQSLETIGQSADADWIVVSPTEGETSAFLAEMNSSPIWQNLEAVKNDRVLVVLDDVWMAGIGYQAAKRIMDEIAEFHGV